MTCIAFDGKTLSADKQVTSGNLARTMTKIRRFGNLLAGAAGGVAASMEMLEWVRKGRIVEEFPALQLANDDNNCFLIVIEEGKTLFYERSPIPAEYEDPTCAIGGGRDYALAAMHCGKTSREAVEIACLFDATCGGGIDSLQVEQGALIPYVRVETDITKALDCHCNEVFPSRCSCADEAAQRAEIADYLNRSVQPLEEEA